MKSSKIHDWSLLARQKATDTYKVFEPHPVGDYDRITALATQISRAPVSLISLVGETSQCFLSAQGTCLKGTPVEQSFCAYAIQSPEPLVVLDATLDPRFANNSLVTGPPYIRMYVGCPLITPQGVAIGALAVISPEPGQLSSEQITGLQNLAELTISLFEQRRISLELENAHQEHEDVIQSVTSIMIVVGSKGRITRFNAAAERAFGVNAGKVLGKTLDECTEQFGWPAFASQVTQISRLESDVRLEDVILHPPSQQAKVLGLQIHPVWSEGDRKGFFIHGADVTARRAHEKITQRQHQRYKQLVERMAEVVMQMTSIGTVTFLNPAWTEITGRLPQDCVGRKFQQFVFAQDRDKMRKAWHRMLAHKAESVTTTFRVMTTSGECRWVEARWQFVRATAFFPNSVEGTLTDITDRKTSEETIAKQRFLEAQLAQAQKMESIGELSAGIAHEINTPMQYIGDNIRFLKRSFATLTSLAEVQEHLEKETDTGEELKELAQEIPIAIDQTLDGIKSVSNIIVALKEFSHPGTHEFVQVDIERTLRSTVTIARNEWKYVANISFDIAPNLPPIWCLPGDFNQVILNLIINSAHAIGDRVRLGHYASGRIDIRAQIVGTSFEVSVKDNGGGIPDSYAGEVFNTFFTTKELGKGTGQGLAICRKIIEDRHLGKIWFESESGEGTTFYVRIPLDLNIVKEFRNVAA